MERNRTQAQSESEFLASLEDDDEYYQKMRRENVFVWSVLGILGFAALFVFV